MIWHSVVDRRAGDDLAWRRRHVSGGIVGAAIYKSLSIWVISQTDYSKLVLGLLIIVLVSLFPQGVLGAFEFGDRTPRAGQP